MNIVEICPCIVHCSAQLSHGARNDAEMDLAEQLEAVANRIADYVCRLPRADVPEHAHFVKQKLEQGEKKG